MCSYFRAEQTSCAAAFIADCSLVAGAALRRTRCLFRSCWSRKCSVVGARCAATVIVIITVTLRVNG